MVSYLEEPTAIQASENEAQNPKMTSVQNGSINRVWGEEDENQGCSITNKLPRQGIYCLVSPGETDSQSKSKTKRVVDTPEGVVHRDAVVLTIEEVENFD